jgi:hypothetical protein
VAGPTMRLRRESPNFVVLLDLDRRWLTIASGVALTVAGVHMAASPLVVTGFYGLRNINAAQW